MTRPEYLARTIPSHPAILPEGLDPLGHIAIVNIVAVHFQKVTQRSRIVSSPFKGRAKFIVQCGSGLLIQAGKLQRLFIPTDCYLRDTLIQEALREPGIG